MDLTHSPHVKTTDSGNNVVSLFGARKSSAETKDSANTKIPAGTDAQTIFSEAIKRNQENRERLRQERLKANKGVLRSYRIKD